MVHAGGCRCGAIRFSASADPHFANICHCNDCRRASGAPMVAFVGFYRRDVTFSGSDEQRYGEGSVRRSFCATCGTPIAYRDEQLPDQIFFVLGAMDEPARYPPTHEGYVSERLPFVHLNDELPSFPGVSVRRPG